MPNKSRGMINHAAVSELSWVSAHLLSCKHPREPGRSVRAGGLHHGHAAVRGSGQQLVSGGAVSGGERDVCAGSGAGRLQLRHQRWASERRERERDEERVRVRWTLSVLCPCLLDSERALSVSPQVWSCREPPALTTSSRCPPASPPSCRWRSCAGWSRAAARRGTWCALLHQIQLNHNNSLN